MSALIPGTLVISDHRAGDELAITFDIEDVDLTGKTLLCQCKINPSKTVALEFKESDNSLQKIVKTDDLTTVTLYKTAIAMEIEPATYELTIVAYSLTTNTQTIVEGSLTVIPQITLRP